MRKKRIFSDLIAYLVLVMVLFIGVIVFLLLPPLSEKKNWAIIALATWYFLWSLWYHYRKEELELRVILEYFVVSLLGAVLLFSLI